MPNPLTCETCPIAENAEASGYLKRCPLGTHPLGQGSWEGTRKCYANFNLKTEKIEQEKLTKKEEELLRQKKILEFVMTRRIPAEMEAQDV